MSSLKLNPVQINKWFLNLFSHEDENLHEFFVFLLKMATQAIFPVLLLLPLPIILKIPLLWGWGAFFNNWWENEIELWSLQDDDKSTFPQIPFQLIDTSDETDSSNQIQKYFDWCFTPSGQETKFFSISLLLNQERYKEARLEERRAAKDWAYYATSDYPEVFELATNFYKLHQNETWSEYDQAANTLSFVQQTIQYMYDKDNTPLEEWPKYPIETLYDGVGDCEDCAILAAAILKRLGFEVALLHYPGHCALGVGGANGLFGDFVVNQEKNICYFYGETTATGWALGEIPSEYKNLEPYIEPVILLINTPQK